MNNNLLSKSVSYLLGYKASGLLSQKSPGMPSLQRQLEKRMKTSLHILTRLDRPVSGLVLFSRKAAFTKHYENQQNNGKVIKTYLAVVEGQIASYEDERIEHFLYQDKKQRKARIEVEPQKNYKSVTAQLSTLKILDNYSVVQLKLLSGSFHQLRAQLAHMGHPVKGDVKYGARRGNKDRSIYLHSYSISFKDLENNTQEYISELPVSDNLWSLTIEALKEA